jgi:hypothetical protein
MVADLERDSQCRVDSFPFLEICASQTVMGECVMQHIFGRYRVAVLAVFLAIAQAMVPATGQTPNSPTHNSQKKNDSSNDAKNPPISSSADAKQVNASATKGHTSEDTEDQKNSSINISEPAAMPVEWRWYDKVAWGFNIALVVVGGFGIRIAINTLKNVARQTKAMEDSIKLQEAAYYQWVDVANWEVTDIENSTFTIEFDVVNPTGFPLTLKGSYISFKNIQPETKHVIYGRFLPPKTPVRVEIKV